MQIIETNGLTKYYGKNCGIEDLNLIIEEGECIGFVGPNGAGKTTTMRLLMGFLKPTKGFSKVYNEISFKNNRKFIKRVSYLPGENTLYKNLTGEDHLYLISSLRGKPKSNLENIIKTFEIPLKRPIKELSTGNRRKISLLLALAFEADLFILDEPTVGLDPIMQERFFDVLFDFKEKGKTFFLSSHYLPEIERSAERIVIIKEHKKVFDGKTEELKEKSYRRVRICSKENLLEQFSKDALSKIKITGNWYEFYVKYPFIDTLKRILELPIQDIKVEELSLEEAFFHFFKEEKKE